MHAGQYYWWVSWVKIKKSYIKGEEKQIKNEIVNKKFA